MDKDLDVPEVPHGASRMRYPRCCTSKRKYEFGLTNIELMSDHSCITESKADSSLSGFSTREENMLYRKMTSTTSTDGDWGVGTKNAEDFAFHENALFTFTSLENSKDVHISSVNFPSTLVIDSTWFFRPSSILSVYGSGTR